MKEQFLRSVAYNKTEINSPNTVTKLLAIEQLYYNFMEKRVLEKLQLKLNKIKAKTNRDMFLQTDAILKLEAKVNEALKKNVA